MPSFTPQKRAGFSLVSVLIAFVIIGIVVILLMRTFTTHFGITGRLNRKVQVNDILVNSATSLMRRGIDDIVAVCQCHGALGEILAGDASGGGPRGNCKDASGNLVGTPLDTANPSCPKLPAAEISPMAFDALLDWNGNLSPGTGQVCMEVARCHWRASQHVLEVTLRGIWKEPSVKMDEKLIVFRRTRW